jgi:hypothetical protein
MVFSNEQVKLGDNERQHTKEKRNETPPSLWWFETLFIVIDARVLYRSTIIV